jgi:glycosyltransferase involved in cell wall biosynthesis
MHILYVINGFDPGGAEHGLLTLIKSGCFDRHELYVLALCRGRGALADRIVHALGADRVHFVTDSEGLTLWACIAGFFRVLISANRSRPQKMVLSLKQANVVGRFAAIFMPGVTCVAFEHIAQYRARRLNGVYGPLLRLLSWRVDEIWADCAETLDRTRTYFLSRQRTLHIVPLFSADANAPRKADYEIGPVLRLAAAGRLVARKNIALIIELVAILRAEGIKATLDVYGDGPEQEALSRLIEVHSLQCEVSLRGYRADWLSLAAQADIFLNLSDMEGFCIVVAEAMNAGLPVVAVDVGGIRDYGRDGKNMLKTAAPDMKAALRLVRLLRMDAALRKRLGSQARADMLANYDADSHNERMKRVFNAPEKAQANT